MTRRTRLLVPLLAALLFAPAATAKPAPAGDAFYAPPSPLPGKAHGDLIWARADASNGNMRISSKGRDLLVLYRSTGITGKPVADSGSVLIPSGKPPKGGWPVLVWAHGTTGLADKCAPTRMPRQTDTYSNDLRAQLLTYFKAGYAVLAPDYEGLGTPGVHPYLIGSSEGHAVLDIVRAARKIEPRLSKNFAIIGHSQGGHAVLWGAALAPKYTPELKLRATVAYAPASHIKDQSNLLDILHDPTPLSALVASIFRGADVAYPQLGIPTLLSDRAAALYPQVDQLCLSEMYGADSWGGIAPADILKQGVDRTPLLQAADKNDPENLTIKSPLEIDQGESDGTVIPLFTDQLVNQLTAKGARVVYKKFPGIDHVGIAQAARKDARAFIKQKLGR